MGALLARSWLGHTTLFAQSLLRLELIAASLGMKTAVGDPKPNGDYTYDFISVTAGTKSSTANDLVKRYGGKGFLGNGDPFEEIPVGPFESLEAKFEEMKRELMDEVRSQLKELLPESKQQASKGKGATPPVAQRSRRAAMAFDILVSGGAATKAARPQPGVSGVNVLKAVTAMGVRAGKQVEGQASRLTRSATRSLGLNRRPTTDNIAG